MKNLRTRLEAGLKPLLAMVPAQQRHPLYIGLGFLTLLLVWLVLLAPLSSARRSLQREIETKEEELAWMQTAAQEVRQHAGHGSGRGGASPLAVIDDSARQFVGLGQAMQRVEPDGERKVRVWLEGAVFDDLLRWLAQLKLGDGIEVEEVVVEQVRPGSSVVNARLTLVRGD